MYVYVILKGIEEKELEKYGFLYCQAHFKIRGWGDDKWREACDTLYADVKPYCIWKLVIIDVEAEVEGGRYELSEDIKALLRDPAIKRGKGNCRPPQQIYILKRRKSREPDNCQENLMEISVDGEPELLTSFVRFFLMDYKDQDYLRDFEMLKLISAAIILGQNDLLEDLTEAYYIYQLQIDIKEEWMKTYLEHQQKILLEQIDEIDKRQYSFEHNKESGSYVIYDYLPEIIVSSFKKLTLKYKYCIIKHKKDLNNWYSDVADISTNIKKYQRAQRAIHWQMRTEMNHRLDVLEGTALYLDGEQKQEIKRHMEKLKEELVPYYTDVWKLNKNLSHKKEKLEKKIEYILGKRKTWKDVGSIVVGMCVFALLLLIPFGGLYKAELEIQQKLQAYGAQAKYPKIGVETFAVIICTLCMAPGAVLLFLMILKDRMTRAKNEYISVLEEINDGFRRNYDGYKKFFSAAFELRSLQKLLLRDKRFQKNETKDRESLRREKENAERSYKNLKEFNEKFAVLIEEDLKSRNMWDCRDDEQITYSRNHMVKVNGEEMPLFDVPPFIREILLAKETCSQE